MITFPRNRFKNGLERRICLNWRYADRFFFCYDVNIQGFTEVVPALSKIFTNPSFDFVSFCGTPGFFCNGYTQSCFFIAVWSNGSNKKSVFYALSCFCKSDKIGSFKNSFFPFKRVCAQIIKPLNIYVPDFFNTGQIIWMYTGKVNKSKLDPVFSIDIALERPINPVLFCQISKLNCYPVSSFRSSPVNKLSSLFGWHSFSEAMRSGTLNSAWLKRSFHF